MEDTSKSDKFTRDILNFFETQPCNPDKFGVALTSIFNTNLDINAKSPTMRSDHRHLTRLVGQLFKTVNDLRSDNASIRQELNALKASIARVESDTGRKCEETVDVCKKTTGEAVKSFANVTATTGSTANKNDWNVVGGRRSSNVSHVTAPIRIVSMQDNATLPATKPEAIKMAREFVDGLGLPPSSVMDVHVEYTRGENGARAKPRAVIIEVSKTSADDIMIQQRVPGQLEKMKGFMARRHLTPLEYRCRQAIWVQFKDELEAAKNTKRFRFLDSFTAVQIGDGPKQRLSKEKLKELGVVC